MPHRLVNLGEHAQLLLFDDSRVIGHVQIVHQHVVIDTIVSFETLHIFT